MKKKLNRKPAYKKGGESWVSDKMANLPMYQMGTQTTFPTTVGFNQKPLTLQPQENRLGSNSLNYGETWANGNPLPQMGMNGFSYNPNSVGNLNEAPSDILQQNQEQYSSYNTNSADTTEPEQLFNPYGGVDIESRLAYGANQLGKGNTAQGILGLASGALGVVRTGMGAYAAGNREKYVMNEYNDRVNKAMTPRTMSLEDGGMIDFMQNGGYNYTPTRNKNMNKYFKGGSIDPPVKPTINPQALNGISTTPISDDMRFNTKPIVRYQPGVMNDKMGSGFYLYSKNITEPGFDVNRDREFIKQSEMMTVQRTPEWANYMKSQGAVKRFQEGGEAGQDQVMQIIQMYAQMAQQDPQAIMEQLQQMSPEEQQQAIQQMAQAVQQPQEEQQFQKGGEFAKKLTGEYTTPLDEDDPTINAEVEKNEYLQSPDGEITKALGETHEKNGTKLNLEGGTRIVSDHLKLGGVNAKHYKENFDLEVKANDTYAKVLDRFTKKSGLQKIVDEQEKVIEQLKKSEEAAQGSSVSESTNNLNKMFLSEKLSELEQEKAPLLEARKALMDDVFQRQEDSKPAEKIPQEEYKTGGEIPKYQGAGSFSDDNLENFYRQSRGLGYTGKKQIGDIQQWMAKNYPEEVVSYFTKSGQPLTAKHVDLIKSNSRDVFVKTGISPDKASADYTSEEKSVLQNALGERANKEFYLQGFTDNKWDWRAPVMGVSPLASMGTNKQQISALQLPNFYREPEKSPITEDTEVGKIKEQQEDTRKGLNLMMLPNQAPMMPDSLEGALKVTRRYDRVDPMQFSPEQQVGAIRGQEAQAMQQINQLPESQRAGALANLSAITQENLAKVYSDVNRTNLAADNQAQQFNAQTQAQEENARGTDLQSYENKIMRAKATTDADRRGYYNQLQAINLANYNSVNNVNLLNQMYDNYGYNGSSAEQTQGMAKLNASQATANGIPVTNTKKKTTKKRFGGKM